MSPRFDRFLAAVAALAAAALLAQSNTATIVGTVSDPTGAAIPGASVTVKNVRTQVARTTTTNSNGEFEASLLSVGDYRISVSMSAFKSVEHAGIHLDAEQKAKIDVTLPLGEVSERVSVEAAATLLATQTSERGLVIGAGQVSD